MFLPSTYRRRRVNCSLGADLMVTRRLILFAAMALPLAGCVGVEVAANDSSEDRSLQQAPISFDSPTEAAPAKAQQTKWRWEVLSSDNRVTVRRCLETGEIVRVDKSAGRVIRYGNDKGTAVVLFTGSMQAVSGEPSKVKLELAREYLIETDPVTGKVKQFAFRGAQRTPADIPTPVPAPPPASPPLDGRR